MRRLLFIVSTLLIAHVAVAAVPLTMSYQGVLRDHGAPVLDDDYAMTFAIYATEVGGTQLWSESRNVGVSDGIFNITLGEATPIDLDFDVTYWLEISVEGEPPMTPRTELTPAPYAHRAIVAESLAGGVPADSDWSMNGDVAYRTQAVGIGTATPLSKLTISSDTWDDHLTLSRLGNAEGHLSIGSHNLVLWSGSGSGLYIDQTGNVGVGVASAAHKLVVDGTAQVTAFLMPTGAADGYVLTSDASGNGTWQPAQSGVGGSGTADYVPKFTGATTLGNSPIRLSGSMVGIGTLPSATLDVNGTLNVEDETYFHSDVFSTNLQSDAGLTLASGSINRMHIDSAGNVGIGTMSPGATLDVNGTTQVTGLRMPTGASDGHVLVSDASGNASWHAGAGLALPYVGSASVYGGHVFHITNTDAGYAGTFIGGTKGVYASAEDGNLPTGVEGRAVVYDVEYGAMGVYGYGKLTSPSATGVSYGVRGLGQGVSSGSQMAYGVFGDAQQVGFGIGVYGNASSITSGGTGYGIYGTASGGSTTYAGYFEGDVHVNGTLSKSAGSFKIDHPLDPENMYLSHSFVESPDMMNVYNGNVTLDAKGEALVELPRYFEVLNRDYRYQLTPIGGAAPSLHIAEKIEQGRFKIAGGDPGLEVSWQVTGIRQDRYAKEHPIEVETMKRPTDQGKYLAPELYGRSERNGIHYVDPKGPESE
ncbi:MAG: hypothetical protein JXB46_07300 [Candidatus Eisenbacteria bacterium]|nr:hypothetical protein [Candidatus Eisenbacteria bacterium]